MEIRWDITSQQGYTIQQLVHPVSTGCCVDAVLRKKVLVGWILVVRSLGHCHCFFFGWDHSLYPCLGGQESGHGSHLTPGTPG